MPYKDYNNKMNEYMKRRYHQRRAFIFETLGNSCNHCGSTDSLEVDHIDRMTKSFPISKMWSVNWNAFVEEVNKCQVLCGPCHKIKTKTCEDWKGRGNRNG